MSTTQTTARVAPRFRIGRGALLSALSVLVAIAVTITLLAPTGANETTVRGPATASQAAGAFAPQLRHLGPRQLQAYYPLSAGPIATAGADRPASAWSCLGDAQPCLP